MIVYFPMETVQGSIDFLHVNHLIQNALIGLDILRVRHEIHPYSHELQHHPAVDQFTGHEVFLATYGMSCLDAWMDRVPAEERDPGVHDVVTQLALNLSDQLNLATSDDFDMEPPDWFGRVPFHESHRRWLITTYPFYYTKHLEFVEWAVSPRLFPAQHH